MRVRIPLGAQKYGLQFHKSNKKDAFELIKSSREKDHCFDIFNHIKEVERWVKWISKKYPQTDLDVLLAVQ